MIGFSEARKAVLEAIVPLGVERVPIAKAAGRVFAEPLVAPFDMPRFDNSQVDGYALLAADGTAPRQIVGESAAGGPPAPPVQPGQAVRIFTGAPIPAGADAVVMQEDVSVSGRNLVLSAAPTKGAFTRRRGEEIVAGTRFDVQRRLVSPALVGLAASFGITEIAVFQRPRVAIVATGSELVPLGRPLGRNQIYASNAEAIAGAVRQLGIEQIETDLVSDDLDDHRQTLSEALESSDVLIVSGGVSVGDHDLVRPTLAALGIEERIWRVAIKPGKPFFFGLAGQRPVFGLPGNPVSAFVTYLLFVRPALRQFLGLERTEEEIVAQLGAPIVRTDLRYEFLRATLQGNIVTPVEAQESHMQTGLVFADALIHLPNGIAHLEAGAEVAVTPIRWGLA